MSKCERCGIEFQAYCAKCREAIRREEMPAVPSEDIFVVVAYDPKTKLYRYGCNVSKCPCNLKNGWCSKATPALNKEFIQMMLNRLHEYDGDNCVKQFCG
uniref:Uncharacterized protein n=1 Tax=viral metagenome TaxID=1070528 RepID=A0A6M3KBB6_9ZZZZ